METKDKRKRNASDFFSGTSLDNGRENDCNFLGEINAMKLLTNDTTRCDGMRVEMKRKVKSRSFYRKVGYVNRLVLACETAALNKHDVCSGRWLRVLDVGGRYKLSSFSSRISRAYEISNLSLSFYL